MDTRACFNVHIRCTYGVLYFMWMPILGSVYVSWSLDFNDFRLAQDVWTPVLVEVPYEFGSVHLLFIFLKPKISKLAHQFLLIFCTKLDSHTVRKITKSNFWRKVLLGQEGPKSPKNGVKNGISGKNLILDLWSQKPQTNQNPGFFELLYLINELRYKVEFLNLVRHL